MNTREKILETAADLLQTHTYMGFSFQDIADRVGIRKASLYHHFPSKEALAGEILARDTAGFREFARQVASLSPADQLRSYFRLYRNHVGAGRRLCPAGGLIGCWDGVSESLRKGTRQMLEVQTDWLRELCLEAGMASDVGTATELADWIVTVMQGGLLVSRTRGDPAPFEAAVQRVKNELDIR